jgi:hypothetical protein
VQVTTWYVLALALSNVGVGRGQAGRLDVTGERGSRPTLSRGEHVRHRKGLVGEIGGAGQQDTTEGCGYCARKVPTYAGSVCK